MNFLQITSDIYKTRREVWSLILDDQEFEDIGRKLGESLEYHSSVTVSYFQSGFIKEMKGIVTKLEPMKRQITLMEYDYEQQYLNFDKVTSVDLL